MTQPPQSKSPVDAQEFLNIAVLVGRKYLACGGPTSRLENKLTLAGNRFGFFTQVFATPTGIIVTVKDESTNTTITEMGRIDDGSIHLAELADTETWLNKFAGEEKDLQKIQTHFSQPEKLKSVYPTYIVITSAFLIGSCASIARYNHLTMGIISGVISTTVLVASSPLKSRYRLSGVFCDFFGSILAFALSFVFTQLFSVPVEGVVAGTLVMLVPGLTLTTAVSELADHNFVSGTAKMMKGILTLLAMGIAYLLFIDLQVYFNGYDASTQAELGPLLFGWHRLMVSFFCNVGSVLGFCVLLRVPKNAVAIATFIGALSWWALNLLGQPNLVVLAPFTTALLVGLVSLAFGRAFSLPSQVYSVPGILSLVPGMLALSSFGTMNVDVPAGEKLFKATLIASSVVFGLFTARVPFVVFNKKNTFGTGE